MNVAEDVSIATPADLSAQPDWERVEREVLCPLCGYNLRGLSEARCPECGGGFEWRDLLDPRRRRHPYLFEHHPERNWWSFWRTLRGGMRPGAFWTTLHPMQPSAPRRMLSYVVMTIVLSAVLSSLTLFAFFATRRADSITSPGVFTHVAEQCLQTSLSPALPVIVLAPYVWALLTFLSFMIFGTSMQMARVRNMHIVRTVVYSFDAIVALWVSQFALNVFRFGYELVFNPTMFQSTVVFSTWFALLFAAMVGIAFRVEFQRLRWLRRAVAIIAAATIIVGAFIVEWWIDGKNTYGIGPISPILCLGFWLLITIRLTYAFRRYLRFPHALAVVLTSQVITPLAIAAAFSAIVELSGLG